MAYTNTASGFNAAHAIQSAASAVSQVFRSLGRAMVLNSSANRRLKQIEVLQSKSDEELAEMGLKREDIARYVFRDILFM
jgi:uncharacterized protein YjiS (DUF1127 family)